MIILFAQNNPPHKIKEISINKQSVFTKNWKHYSSSILVVASMNSTPAEWTRFQWEIEQMVTETCPSAGS